MAPLSVCVGLVQGPEEASNLQKMLIRIMVVLTIISLSLCLTAFIYLLTEGEAVRSALSFTVVLLVASIPVAIEIVSPPRTHPSPPIHELRLPDFNTTCMRVCLCVCRGWQVCTTTLALGSRQLSKDGAIVSRLAAIEDMAGQSVTPTHQPIHHDHTHIPLLSSGLRVQTG